MDCSNKIVLVNVMTHVRVATIQMVGVTEDVI